ncbi:unnamed protein product, partial [Prorocentrum cordatum]
SATTPGSARARRAGCGSGLWRCSVRFARRSWSPTLSYSSGISACETGEQWQRALALLSEMCEAKLEPDVIYPLQRWDQRVREGRALAAGARAAQRDVGGEAEAQLSYSAGVSACEKGEQWQPALALLSEMWEAKLKPNVSATTLGSARARRASSGRALWRC